jgi:23S rRNA pseudouridine955/2504/2580 synthase
MNAVIKVSAPATKQFWEIPVLFEDAELLALDKPVGLSTVPEGSDPNETCLMKLLHAAIAEGKPWAVERQLTFLTNVNRLDPETGGVLLLAKSKPTHAKLADLFGANQPARKYVALVHGAPQDEHFEISGKIGPHPTIPGMMWVDPKAGKKSQTSFDVLERFADQTLLRCQPLTERPHQIRVHLQNSGLRVVGDQLYGGKPLWLSRLKRDYRLKPGREERPLISQPALHAEQLEFPHPTTGQTININSPWPKALNVALKYLRQYSI